MATSSGDKGRMNRLRAIVVDDDPDARGLARTALEHAGFEIDEADGSEQLFAILESRPRPDAILLDLTFTGLSGWHILRTLKADPVLGAVPVIVVSGRVDDQFFDAALGIGACAYITKPYRVSDLLVAVRRNVGIDAPIDRAVEPPRVQPAI